jgi:hypothetical protein
MGWKVDDIDEAVHPQVEMLLAPACHYLTAPGHHHLWAARS